MHTDDLADPGGSAGTGQLPSPRSPFSTAGPRRRFRATPFHALLVVGGLLIGVGTGWLVKGPGDAPALPAADITQSIKSPSAQGSYPTPARFPTAARSAKPAPTAAPVPSPAPTVPPDFAVVRDPSGVTLAVPTGWRRSEAASVYYRAPGRGSAPYTRFLQFWPLAERNISATRALRITVATHRGLPGFALQALHPTGKGAAELVYSYDSTRAGRRLTLVQRVFTAPDGRRYAFAVVGPAKDRPWQRTTLTAVLAAFAVD